MPVNSPPVLIDTADLPDPAFHQNQNTLNGTLTTGQAQCRELFNVGGNLYAVLRNDSGFPIGTVDIRVFKSTDGGNTWVPKDTAHEPGINGDNTDALEGVFLQGTKIYVAWRFKPAPLSNVSRMNSFDTTTDTWQGQSPDSPNPFGSALQSGLAVLSNTDAYVMTGFSGQTNLRYIKFSGGVWAGAAVDISPNVGGTTGFYKAHLVDATDTIHLVYAELVAGVSMNLYYVQISSTGVVGARTLLLAGGVAEIYNVGNMCFQGANVVVPYQRQLDFITTVLIGTPLAAPVFAATVIDPGATTVTLAAFFPCAVLDGSGNINVFWATNSAGNLDDRIWLASQQSPTFSAPAAWYKNALFPPGLQAPANPGLVAAGSPTLLPGTQFGMLWDTITLADQTTYLLIGAGGAGPAGVLTLKFAGTKIFG